MEHPITLAAMRSLAEIYQKIGKYREAEKLQIQVLDARNRILGEHPDKFHVMVDLALTYLNLGKYTEARNLQIQVLDANTRILGVEHPDTNHVQEI